MSNLIEDMKRNTECSICSSRWFSTDLIALPCTHVCCSECYKELQENYKDNLRIDCPSCQVMMTFPNDNSSFPYCSFDETSSNGMSENIIEVPDIVQILELDDKSSDSSTRSENCNKQNDNNNNISTNTTENRKQFTRNEIICQPYWLELEKMVFLPLNVTYICEMAIANNRLYLLCFVGSIFEQTEVICSYSMDGKFENDVINVTRFLKGSAADSICIDQRMLNIYLCCSRLNKVYKGSLNDSQLTLTSWLSIVSPTKVLSTEKGLIIVFDKNRSLGLYDGSAKCCWKYKLEAKISVTCSRYDGDHFYVIDENKNLMMRSIENGHIKGLHVSKMVDPSYNIAAFKNGIIVAEQVSNSLKFYNNSGAFNQALAKLDYRPEKITSYVINNKDMIYLTTTVNRVTRLSIFKGI